MADAETAPAAPSLCTIRGVSTRLRRERRIGPPRVRAASESVAMTNQQPFIGSQAVASGKLRGHQLRSRFRAVFPDVYVRRDQELTLRQRAVAAWLWSHRQAVIAGLTAAAWHDSKWVDERAPVKLIWSNARSPGGVRTYDMKLRPEDFTVLQGVPVTTPERTAFDIDRRERIGPAVAHLDALVAATAIKVG
jgi:hypothetical protein